MTKNETVCILGTGYYGIALGKRLLSYGYHIVYGSRNPDLNYLNECFENLNNENYSVCSVAEAWLKSTRFVFFAVSAFDSVYESIVNDLFSNLKISKKSLSSRIVIEISNVLDGNQNSKLSNAQKLQNLFQNELEKRSINCQIHVCKGFNLTSAYSLSEQADNLRKEALTSKMAVPIAGDDLTSKQSVIELCNGLGFSAYDFGK
jgi:predicted dinucleotide-binding enzyme